MQIRSTPLVLLTLCAAGHFQESLAAEASGSEGPGSVARSLRSAGPGRLGWAAKHHSRAEALKARQFSGTFTGRATYYAAGLGACGGTNSGSDPIVALNGGQFYSASWCGKQITISGNGATATATVVDSCPGCPWGAIDMSEGLFQQFAPLSDGQITVTWSVVGASKPPPKKPPPPPPSPTTTSSTWSAPASSTTSSTSSSSSTSASSSSSASATSSATSSASTSTATPGVAAGVNSTAEVGGTGSGAGLAAGGGAAGASGSNIEGLGSLMQGLYRFAANAASA